MYYSIAMPISCYFDCITCDDINSTDITSWDFSTQSGQGGQSPVAVPPMYQAVTALVPNISIDNSHFVLSVTSTRSIVIASHQTTVCFMALTNHASATERRDIIRPTYRQSNCSSSSDLHLAPQTGATA